MVKKLAKRLARLESRFHLARPTPEQLKRLIVGARAGVLFHVIPRVSLKFYPETQPPVCPHCGDAGSGSTVCPAVLVAESEQTAQETRLRDLERAIDLASPELILEGLRLAEQEMEGDPRFRDFLSQSGN